MSEVEHLDIRRLVGLNAAHDGDIHGLRRFLRFFGGEIRTLAFWPTFPDDLKIRLSGIGRECEQLESFLDGYMAAITASPAPSGEGQ